MAIFTTFLKLLKPEKNDYVDVEKHISENYDKIDNKVQELSNSNDGKLNKGNLPITISNAETIIKVLQGGIGIKADENLLYLNDEGTKIKGHYYLDRLTDGIFECIQETTTTVNNATYFKNFSNKENADKLSELNQYTEVTLWEGNLTSTETIQLSESYKNFNCIKFVCYVIGGGFTYFSLEECPRDVISSQEIILTIFEYYVLKLKAINDTNFIFEPISASEPTNYISLKKIIGVKY